MKVINASEFHRVELIVPVIKDLTYLGAFEQGDVSLNAEDPLESYNMRVSGQGEGMSLSHVLKEVDDDPLKSLINSAGQVMEESHKVLESINEALGALTGRIELARMLLEKDEFDGGVANFLEGGNTAGIRPIMQEWKELCYMRRDKTLPDGSPLPEVLGTHHVPQVLLHSKTAWSQLEHSFKAVASRFFSSSNLVRGMFPEDGTIDYSLVYTLFTNNVWQDSLPLEVNKALRAFCQRTYFGAVDGVPRFFKVI